MIYFQLNRCQNDIFIRDVNIDQHEDFIYLISDCRMQNAIEEEEIKNVEEMTMSESQSDSPISSLDAFMRLRGHEKGVDTQKDKGESKKHKSIDIVVPGLFSEYQKDLLSILREINKCPQTVLYLPGFSIPIVHVISTILFNVSRRNEKFVFFFNSFSHLFICLYSPICLYKQDVDSCGR